MKKKKLVIDSELMMNFLQNGTSYLNDGTKRSMYLSFDKIFKSITNGFFLILIVFIILLKIVTIKHI